MSFFEIHNLTKAFNSESEILSEVNLSLSSGETVAILGESGSGKSTLLQICGLLDQPNSGEVYLDGLPLHNLSDNDKTRLRREKIGFIYQFHHLLREFTLLENLVIPQLILNIERKTAEEKALFYLEELGLGDKKQAMPHEISGGQKQRVAIIRGVINNPKLILADEPTGSLDNINAFKAFDLLKSLVKNGLLILATHSMELASSCDRIFKLVNGKINPL